MALVVAQVAFSLLLLVGAGLVLRSLEKIRPTRLGFSTESMVVGIVRLDEAKYDRAKTQEFYRQLSERLAALPGVQSASFVRRDAGNVHGWSRGAASKSRDTSRGPGEDMQIDAVTSRTALFHEHESSVRAGHAISRNAIVKARRAWL